MVVALVGMLAYTQVAADTPYVYLAAALLVLGLGIGSTIMPSMAAAFRTLSREETPRATSALNTVQRVAGAIGTALLAIVLQRAVAGRVPGFQGGIQGMAALSRRADAAPQLAGSFGTAFWVAAGFIGAALVPALLLPGARRHEERAEAAPASAGAEWREAA
jgi:hypothetical protein